MHLRCMRSTISLYVCRRQQSPSRPDTRVYAADIVMRPCVLSAPALIHSAEAHQQQLPPPPYGG